MTKKKKFMFIVREISELDAEIEYRPESSFDPGFGDQEMFDTLGLAKNYLRVHLQQKITYLRGCLEHSKRLRRDGVVREGLKLANEGRRK